MSPADSSNGPATPENKWFASTHWSVVLAARGNDSPQAHAALESLYRSYWLPLYTYLRRSGASSDDAPDLTQGFFAYVIEKDVLAKADRERGKFRNFLLTCLKHYTAGERVKAGAAKRGGRITFVPLDDEAAEAVYLQHPADALSPEKAFDRTWALKVLEKTMDQLRHEFATGGKPELFECLQGFLASREEATPYAELSEKLTMSENALRSAVFRLRQRYREVLRQIVADTVATPADIDEEIRYLIEVVAG